MPSTDAYEIEPVQILYQMLWSRRAAAKWLRMLGVDYFAGIVPLGPSIASVIDDHDRTRPDAPAQGQARVLSIVEHATELAADVRQHPSKYANPVQSIYARQNGQVDVALLRHAPAVVAELPRIAVAGDEPPPVPH